MTKKGSHHVTELIRSDFEGHQTLRIFLIMYGNEIFVIKVNLLPQSIVKVVLVILIVL